MINTFKRFFINGIKGILNFFGYSIFISKAINSNKISKNNEICINIGSGDWKCDGWINLDYPTKWYAKSQSHNKFIPYDIRKDLLPFKDESVDLIYCSHVIEHIENEYIDKLFNECYRVLKTEGGGRFCCPDAEFLYEVTKTNKDYWDWRKSWFSNSRYCKINATDNLKEVDKLVAETATPKFQSYKGAIPSNFDYEAFFENDDMNSFFERMTQDLSFRPEWPGDHINWWTFDKMKKKLQQAGFKTVIRSKFGGSIFNEMRNISKFDTTEPQMSLYVEFIKKGEE